MLAVLRKHLLLRRKRWPMRKPWMANSPKDWPNGHKRLPLLLSVRRAGKQPGSIWLPVSKLSRQARFCWRWPAPTRNGRGSAVSTTICLKHAFTWSRLLLSLRHVGCLKNENGCSMRSPSWSNLLILLFASSLAVARSPSCGRQVPSPRKTWRPTLMQRFAQRLLNAAPIILITEDERRVLHDDIN